MLLCSVGRLWRTGENWGGKAKLGRAMKERKSVCRTKARVQAPEWVVMQEPEMCFSERIDLVSVIQLWKTNKWWKARQEDQPGDNVAMLLVYPPVNIKPSLLLLDTSTGTHYSWNASVHPLSGPASILITVNQSCVLWQMPCAVINCLLLESELPYHLQP